MGENFQIYYTKRFSQSVHENEIFGGRVKNENNIE